MGGPCAESLGECRCRRFDGTGIPLRDRRRRRSEDLACVGDMHVGDRSPTWVDEDLHRPRRAQRLDRRQRRPEAYDIRRVIRDLDPAACEEYEYIRYCSDHSRLVPNGCLTSFRTRQILDESED